ncbi:MAG: hypothetical protein GXC76_08340 [Rhodanobacteraceae bacterium]|jgi:hypothetical protein|nr:hypothetical protein [Rhodanobacteraceae bacterium]
MKTPLLAVGLAFASALANARTPAASAPDEHAWQAWSAAVEQTLRTSEQPRDWALAAVSMAKPPAADAAADAADALLQRALAAAPDDMLAHWLAVQRYLGQKQDELDARSASVLTRREPDNAASWLPAVALAARGGDAAALDAALARMAAATRYDDHFAAALRAWMEAFERQPPQHTGRLDAEGAAFMAALARASALAVPAYGPLFAACKGADGTPLPAQRRGQCNAIGRLLLHAGTTRIDRDIGARLLRYGGDAAPTEADRAMIRRLAWQQQQAAPLRIDEDPVALRAYATDWRSCTDEVEVIERALRRAGLPVEPPADWTPPRRDGA